MSRHRKRGKGILDRRNSICEELRTGEKFTMVVSNVGIRSRSTKELCPQPGDAKKGFWAGRLD